MHAILVGATGATGADLLPLLLADDTFERVDIFVRKQPALKHPKLHVYVVNFDRPNEWTMLVKGDVLFSALGTTLKAAGSKEAQWKVDHDYQLAFAKAAKEADVPHYVLVSSAGASARSPLFYPKMKGALEDRVKALDFDRLTIFNPPILERKDSDRAGEVIGLKVIRALNAIGLFRSQTPLPTGVLAAAMVAAAKAGWRGVAAYRGKEIWRLAGVEQ